MKQEPARADARPPRLLARIASLLWSNVKAYFNDKVPRLGAELAFYTTIAVAKISLASAIMSFIVFAGSDGWTTNNSGVDVTSVTGAKSRRASYGIFG